MLDISPFPISISEAALQTLKVRLKDVRWPDAETVPDWSQGVPLGQMKSLVEYWRDHYDWRRCEAMLNDWGLLETRIDGIDIRFLHIRSPHPEAMPLLLTHGWPGSIIEFHKVIGPLTEPERFGGDKRDAFHLVIPCLPGYGFSGKPVTPGWQCERIASAWNELMDRLGYGHYVAQGGDWGSIVTVALARMAPASLRAVHLNQVLVIPFDTSVTPEDEDHKAALEALVRFTSAESGYAAIQSTRPQTLGYGLADSPVGQAAWIYEKMRAWSDCAGDPLSVFSYDELLDNIMLYWLTNSGASSARLYWETSAAAYGPSKIEIPIGCSIFPKENLLATRRLAEKYYSNIIHWNELPRGGHFPAFEQPDLFTQEIRSCFSSVR
ncbi:epoxide hydrolase [Sphingobium lactosutens]|uniref:epoxide hydrolase family protein n=1 Tax=Sphingobium lactosutens TaxID=522773 RepID=UPI0015B80CEF|nr:epoxide hydrolase family protein [Sphingobium lactosutens]NWK94452.1 epoxide hydrolase [Sphingobium lactosutens]